MSAKRCPHKFLPGPSLDGLLYCNECDAEVIRGYVVADTLDEPNPKTSWSVEVERLSENNFRTMFKVGVQGFTLAHEEDHDEAESHCRSIARMFCEAMSRAGYRTTPAHEDWALNQLALVGTLVGSHNTAEALGDVRALVVEVANGTGPLAEACKRQLALADAIDESRKETM